MEKYSTYFSFKYTEYEIPVTNCFLDPNHYNPHQLDEEQLINCMLLFVAGANRPSSCAYLMPVKNCGQTT
ncbi:hypothetical protein GOP47_0001407 [Adiantum capillus-veneris]|uniref:Uncharacterized protein n=1 Tax=Adiantum capillus-veneris TaxID=13818 RepID=A0A9D4V8V7_ADICA|nr:hypothetical protein GOP47_0001407 [Adiantum capillus-veneris]